MATKTKLNLRPLGERVIVQAVPQEEKTAGGVILPDTAKEKPQQGKVIAVGKGITNDKGVVTPLTVKEGDRVLYGKWTGTEVKIDGEDYLIIKESEIFAILS
ncbi:MAG: 10 kDa chaperonin [Candidatus Xenobia bacterium]|jgi:chaperonin GroES